jgi:glycosyltransferase involved in cell wall biosynthesis
MRPLNLVENQFCPTTTLDCSFKWNLDLVSHSRSLQKRTSGIFVQPDSEEKFVEGLYHAMYKLANSPQLRYEMGIAGQAKAMAQFSWQQKIDQVQEFYAQIINKSGLE